jgi:hypothetical protein
LALDVAKDFSVLDALVEMIPLQTNFVVQLLRIKRRLTEFCWVALSFEDFALKEGRVEDFT